MGELPSSEELGAQADGTQHLVLHISKSIRGFNKAALIKKLQRELPGHSVFANGSDADSHMITIKNLVTKRQLTANESAFLSAVTDYQSICTVLLEAHKVNRLRGGWRASPQGEHIRFRNAQTGQVVDAPVGSGDVAKPDPRFVWEYVTTTAEYAELSKLFPGGFHELARMLEGLDL